MRLIRYAGAALTIAAVIVLAAAPAFASGPVIYVTPSPATPGNSETFAVTCGPSATSATLFGATLGLPEQIPMQPSAKAGDFATTVDLPTNIASGTYKPSIDCSNGSSGTATVVVIRAPGATGAPAAAPATGDGATSTAMGGPFEVVGISLLGIGGLAGMIAFGRRGRSGPGA